MGDTYEINSFSYEARLHPHKQQPIVPTGSVIVYGTVASVVCGVVDWI